MTMRMLVDAAHPEETRVVVIKGNRLEDFDYASSTKTQLRGNIYLAKITRVEPSLQAAFVDYGGNRHGFLAFSEIHPDYYQIPVADREALLAQEAAQQLADAAEENHQAEDGDDPDAHDESDEAVDQAIASDEGCDGDDEGAAPTDDREAGPEADGATEDGAEPDVLSADDEAESARRRRARLVRSYNIQEVIKRHQVLLVQVVKEERGNKGAALTTYLSLAGRNGVLMPNTARGGGISRKIADSKDRKRLRTIVDELAVPAGMGLIVRTAGANRSKSEVKRDYDFLMRTWDSVRDLTLKSTAPTLVYEEANLIKRAIRDLYSKDIEEVLVEGEEAYKAAKSFMRMLMPSHAKRVQPHRDRVPLFHRYQVEERFDAMHATEVRLKGGGYIVINPTEALVAIDVNSGKATKERNIEETALRTNLEAAEELARHLRLRDLGGLIVIDFIDMNENKHNRAVERCFKEALKQDRARIQVGRISSFGLLEMSRQRMRPSLFEASSETCPHCHGMGSIRSRESIALHVLRTVETEGIRKSGGDLTVYAPTPVAIYILNQKRASVAEIEQRYQLRVLVVGDDTLIPPDIRIERTEAPLESSTEMTEETEEAVRDTAVADNDDDDGQRNKKRRRGRRGGRRRKRSTAGDAEATVAVGSADGDEVETAASGRQADGSLEATPAAGTEKPADAATEDEVPTDIDSSRDDAGWGAPAPHDHHEPNADQATASRDEPDQPDEPVASETEDDAEPVLPATAWHSSRPDAEDGNAPQQQPQLDWSETAPGSAATGDGDSAAPALAAEAGGEEEAPSRKARRGWWRRRTNA